MERILALVLIIDDDESMRRMIRRILEPTAHDVIEAPEGRIGVQLFADRRPDIIITDIIMPGKEGIETILDIRKSDPTIGIIAISGGGIDIGRNYLGLAGRIGASAVLAKPFRACELSGLVEEVLVRSRGQSG